MDKTLQPGNIQDVLRNFDRKKDSEKRGDAAAQALNIASAIGTETPMTLLVDIRQCICDLIGVVKRSTEEAETREARSECKHNEVLAYMSEISTSLQKLQDSTHTPTPTTSLTPRDAKREQREYYYGSDRLATKDSVIGCVLMQVYNVAARHGSSGTFQQTDAVLMELRHWSSLVSIVSQAESVITDVAGKLTLPKQTSHESMTASELVASTKPGRNTSCKLEHLAILQDDCPSVVSAVKEVKDRIVACPGLISPSRHRCLASILFPFITRDGSLNTSPIESQRGPTKVVLDAVSKLNIPQKKQYASKVLGNRAKPLVAAKELEKLKAGTEVV